MDNLPNIETASRERLAEHQLRLLKEQLQHVYQNSPMYRAKFDRVGLKPQDVSCLDDFTGVPFTTKEELRRSEKQSSFTGDYFCVSQEDISRVFQTSGTSGMPLRVGFTAQDWSIFSEMWVLFAKAWNLKAKDAAFIPFGYGLFIAWWGAHYGFEKAGLTMIPGGAQSSEVRVRNIIDWQATVVCGTPTYMLKLAEVAKQIGIELADSPVRVVIVGGEPGGQVEASKQRLELSWGAKVYDQIGCSELGPHSFECAVQPGGAHLLENYYLAEVIDPETGKPVRPGEIGELVLTNLAFKAMPLIRYRTRDIVRLNFAGCDCGRTFARLEGGILGRADDMINVAGVNLFPAALENFIRQEAYFADDYQVIITEENKLILQVEPAGSSVKAEILGAACKRLTETVKFHLGFTPSVEIAVSGSLPRYELKSKRVIKKGSS